jgi:hypothetical protein
MTGNMSSVVKEDVLRRTKSSRTTKMFLPGGEPIVVWLALSFTSWRFLLDIVIHKREDLAIEYVLGGTVSFRW